MTDEIKNSTRHHCVPAADAHLARRVLTGLKGMRAALAPLYLLVSGVSSTHAQLVTVNPVEASGPLTNPLMGFRNDLNSYSQYPYPSVVRQYIKWNEIENSEADTVQKIRDFCNTKWANLPANNIKVIPRVYIDWDSNAGNENWPADLQTNDWSSQQFKDRVVRLVGRLGEVWDNDPRVAWVQTGIIGYWGEQENPVGIDQDGWAQRLGSAYTSAFKNKKLIVRNMSHWPGYEMGVYWDSFGHPSQPGVKSTIKSFNDRGRYLSQIVEGEVAYDWGQTTFDPVYGGEPEITLNNATYTDNMIDVIRELHGSALGWIASYKLDGSNGTDPNTVRANAARMQKEFGYRFHITEFSCSARTEPGSNLSVQFKVKNSGSAPIYENWPVAVVLINESTRQVVWKATLPDLDIRTWRPGDNYNTITRTYQTPAQEYPFSASIPLPAGLASGQYLVGLSILEPMSRTPGVFFAVPNFFKESQSQPLCRIGVGTNAASNTLTGVFFNDLVNDDNRTYTLTAQGPTYNLTPQVSTTGSLSLSPAGGSYAKDTGVRVTATGKLGYVFSSWAGALAGSSSNPAIVVMDANKNVSANYVAVPTYTLGTSATNGSVLLNPPGGVYNTGTVVTVTANPKRGYVFGSWSGDLAGSTISTTLVMTGNKSVTANFSAFNGDVAPWTETFSLADGTKTNGSPTAWTATRTSGLFDVQGNRLTLNQGGTEGVFETGEISISGGSVRISLDVQSAGAMESTDYARFYKIVDGGAPELIGQEILGGIIGTNTLVATNNIGSRLKLRILTKVSASDEFYYFDNLKVENEVPPTYTLTTSAINGSITLAPSGGVYDPGTVVTLSPVPASGYKFESWSGDLTGNLNPTTITMDAAKNVAASFSVIPSYTLTTSTLNGSISLSPPPNSGHYLDGSVVTVTANPNAGYAFGNWSGDLSGTTNPTTITINGNKNVIANFNIYVPENRIFLFVVGDAASLNSSDLAIRNRFENFGYSVQVMSDEVVTAANATGKALILTSSTVASGTVNTKFRDVGVPVVNWETFLQDDYGFATTIGNSTTSQTALDIVNQGHPIAAGMAAGIRTVSNVGGLFSAAVPGGSPIIVARLNDTSARPCIYAYESNTAMASGTAPARRVQVFLQDETFASLNTEGLKLFDAAVAWALGRSSLCWIQAPMIQSGQMRIEWLGGTLQTATDLAGPWNDIPGATSPYLAPVVSPKQFFRVKQ